MPRCPYSEPSPWVCIRTQPHRETFAEGNLLRANFEVYCPRYDRWISHARKRKLVRRPLFPNYVFVRSGYGLSGMSTIQRTPGVVALASHDLLSAVVADAVIDALRARENEVGVIEFDAARFSTGDAVRITAGAFADFEAIFAEDHDGRRCRVLLSLLGKQHSILTHSHFLEKVV